MELKNLREWNDKGTGYRKGSIRFYFGNLHVATIEPLLPRELNEDDNPNEDLFFFHSMMTDIIFGGKRKTTIEEARDEIKLAFKEFASKFIK